MSKIREILSIQIEAANGLLQRAIAMPKGRPSRNLAGFISYDDNVRIPLSRDTETWETETAELLRVLYGEESRQVSDFLSYIQPKNHYFDFRRDLQTDLNRYISFLNALIKADTMKLQLSTERTQTVSIKPPKVFISHKKEDKAYADALVSLINFILGADGDKIFCSSIPGYGIRQSRDILDELKRQFDQYEVYMVIIHSPRYYQSAICLNEMGASWALGTKFSSFLTNDCKLENLHGVINQEKICIDLNDDADMLNGHLNEFKDDLIAFFHTNAIDQTKWENARGRFIKEVKALTYDSPKEEMGEVSTIKEAPNQMFTEKEYEVLRQWVVSNNNTGMVYGVIGGELYVLGDNQYEISSGREEARWKAFIKKLQNADFIEYVGKNNQGAPVYELQNSAYEFFE